MPKMLVLLVVMTVGFGVACSQASPTVKPPTDLADSASPTASPSIYVPVSHSPKPPKPSTIAPVAPVAPVSVAPYSPPKTTPPTKAPSTTVLFTSPGKKYTLRYPKTWTASKKKSGTDLRILDQPSGSGAADIWSLSEAVTAGTPTSAILADGVAQLSAFGISSVKKTDSTKTTLDGQPGQLVTYSGTTGSGGTVTKVTIMQLASKNKTTGIVLSLTAKPKDLTGFTGTFQGIINSFVFLTTK